MANITNPLLGVDVVDRTNAKLLRWGLIYTGPTSYVTGGDPIAPADVGLGTIDLLLVATAYNGTDVRLVHYRTGPGKILWMVPNTNAEVANGTDLSGYAASFLVAGH